MRFRVRTIRVCLFLLLPMAAASGSDLDPSWNVPGGYTITPLVRYDQVNPGTAEADPGDIAIDSVGRVVLAGYSYPYYQQDPQFTAVRYLGDNAPLQVGYEDPGFKNGTQDGVAVVAVGSGPAYGHAVQIGAADGVVIAGDCLSPGAPPHYQSFCLARFNSTGAVDTLFGNQSNGTTITTIGSADAYAKAMTTDSTGSFLVAGFNFTGAGAFTVARYNGSGFQDGGFGGSGLALAASPDNGNAYAYAIAVDGNGNIVVAGSADSPNYPEGRFAITRLTPTGQPDPTFNGGALVTIDMGGGVELYSSPQAEPHFALAIDASNRPIVVGLVVPSLSPSVIGIARLTTAGALDATFGTGGKVTTALTGCSYAMPTGVQIDRAGNLFVSAGCDIPSPAQTAAVLVHYTPRGHVDSAYGPNGYATVAFGVYSTGVGVMLDYLGRPMLATLDLRNLDPVDLSAFAVTRHDYIESNGFE